MEKLTNEERARLDALANEYEKKIDGEREEYCASLDEDLRRFLRKDRGGSEFYAKLQKHLNSGKKPSDFFKTTGNRLFGGCIPKRFENAFLWAADNVTAWIYPDGWSRRTFRSADISLYERRIYLILTQFIDSCRIDAELADILEDKLPEEQLAYKRLRMRFGAESYIMAYEIDKGNSRVIEYVKNALDSGSDTAVSYELLHGVFMSRNEELHEAVCRLLLAARLQEGLRQAVCECADEGGIEPFIKIIKTIRDNDLIRYSAVKRAVGCWVGLMTEETRDLDRISGKTLDIIVDCLESPEYINECLQTEDSMKIYIALWALACREFHNAESKIEELIDSGTAHQAMTAGVFLKNAGSAERQRLAVKAVLKRSGEYGVTAVFLPQISDSNSWYSYGGQELTPMSRRYDKPTAEKLYETLNALFEQLPKDMEFSPCVFPWNAEELTKTDIIKRLCVIASDLEDNDKIDETCVKIPLIKLGSYGTRQTQIKMLLSHPKTEVQLDTLVSLASDKEEYARKTVFEILKTCELREKHYKMLEDMLRYKAADMRQKLIDVLFRQPGERLYECVKRLVSDKKEEKRTAGLDMVIRVNESDKPEQLKEKYRALADIIEAPTSKEKILIERIRGVSSAAEEENALYGDTDDYEPRLDEKFIAECKKEFIGLFPQTRLFGNKPGKKKLGLAETLTALDKLIEQHKNDEYLDAGSGETRLLADNAGYNSFKVKEADGTEHIAFKELWDEFYEKSVKSAELLFYSKLALEHRMVSQKFTDKIYGGEFSERPPLAHYSRVWRVLDYLASEHPLERELLPAACALGHYIACEAKTDDLYEIEDYEYGWNKAAVLHIDGKTLEFDNMQKKRIVTAVSDDRVNYILGWLGANPGIIGERFGQVFALRVMIGKRFGFFERSEILRNSVNSGRTYAPFEVSTLILAAYKEIISRGYMYKMLLGSLLSDALSALSQLISFRKSGETKAVSRYFNYRGADDFIKWLLGLNVREKLSEHTFTDEENKLLDFAYEIGENVINTVLKTELVRGDTETRYSKDIMNIKRIYGAENLVSILAAMGKDTLDRSTYFYCANGVSKKQSLSYLLGVCVPNADDTAEKLKALVSKTDVSENRIVEAALFSPAWIDAAEEYLGWKGFKSACYYFIAHTSEKHDEKTAAVIAKYTPVSVQDLSVGAFDVDWFNEAFDTIGGERFNKIYNAAKYISDGAKHTRARKYADAVRGKLDIKEAEKNVADKRNKDTLMAYALIPLSGGDDMSKRYLFIQEFKKQAKQFGAQRKSSETAAAECALQNLAKNAGFADVSRLTLRMEAKLFENVKPLLDWNDIDDIRLKLEIDGDGKAEILCEKAGKALKSIPAKYKKNERVIEFSETKKMLAEQYRRTRQMFEEAMENGSEFTAEELSLLCENPAIKPIVTRLVYIFKGKLGFLDGYKLVDHSGGETKLTKKSSLKIAHPFDIYTDGHWRDYQKHVFDNGIVQPFKQIFRELYVKTDEEKTALRSTRYAGNQIQPQKAKACLKTRRWVCDIEAGLQKVYYKENIIASIYALADWFSPSDIEAPTLEWVEFFERKTGKAMRIEDVPDVIFSEVMRDVDLAVSVAHAGGVDPEASHSTIEMRSAIIEFTLPLFKLKNVTLEKSHAFIEGKRADYSIHLGSGVVHIQGGPMINVLPVHSQHRGRLFLPFVDDDPKTSQIISEILLFAEDDKIKDPFILEQIK